MESVGQILKAARERRQITVTDVVVATKMTSAFVKAIETDNFEVLVAPVYARGFIKLYAECVGLDPVPLQKQFDARRRGPAAPGKVAAACAKSTQPPRLQHGAPLPRQEAPEKPAPGKAGLRPPPCAAARPAGLHRPDRGAGGQAVAGLPKGGGFACAVRRGYGRLRSMAGGRGVAPATPAAGMPAWINVQKGMAGLRSACPASLRAMRSCARNRMRGAHIQWPRFGLSDITLPVLSFPAAVWRRIGIVAGVVLLIFAVSLAWEWSRRGLPYGTDACRWLAEPPAPYLTMDNR